MTMPSAASSDLIRRAYEAFRSDDADALAAMMHPESILITRITSVAGEPYRGPDGIRAWFAETKQLFSRFEVTLGNAIEPAPGVLLVDAVVDVVGKESQVPLRENPTYLILIEDDLIRRLELFSARAEAEAAARAAVEGGTDD
jgi:ketosteroid isomerase-like protein